MRKRSRQLSRTEAMRGVPIKANVVRSERKDNKVYLTVEFNRPGWQRMIGADRVTERTFGLDAYGEEVYELCDGKKSVKDCVRIFAKKHHLSRPEAELAVTTFLKTLTNKGLVGIALKEDDS